MAKEKWPNECYKVLFCSARIMHFHRWLYDFTNKCEHKSLTTSHLNLIIIISLPLEIVSDSITKS